MSNTKRFTGKANAYTKARPNYPIEFINFLFNDFGIDASTTIADIGSGTGILSKEFLERDCIVYCVEPNNDMRKVAEDALSSFGNFITINATAENTTLLDNSVDFITVAQAFHWFDTVKFKQECQRILKEAGYVFLVWNFRVEDSEIVKENALICKKYCPDFIGFNGGDKQIEERIASFFDGKFTKKRFENNLEFSKETFIKRNLSSSYSIQENDKEFQDYVSELETLFDKHAVNNILHMPNETIVYFGRIELKSP